MQRAAAILITAVSTACFAATLGSNIVTQPASKHHQHEAEILPPEFRPPVIEYCRHCSAWRWSSTAPSCRSREWRRDCNVLSEVRTFAAHEQQEQKD